jgi:hypothetical protein
MQAKPQVLLFAHPRSGSSSVYQILQLHPELNILEEPFNEGFTTWNPQAKNYRELVVDIPSLDAQISDILTTYNGIKMLDYQLPDPFAVHLLQRPDWVVIFLRRRNLLQAVVSVLIATQTRLWKTWDMHKPLEAYYQDLQPLSIPEIQQRVIYLKQHMDMLEAIVDRRPADTTIKLVYEDLYFAPAPQREAQIAAIWHMLKLDRLPPEPLQQYLQPEQAKVNSAATYALLPNAKEIHEQCGNDLTGWLYE